MGEGRASRDFNFNARILINKQIRQNTQQSLRKAQECEQEIGHERERERADAGDDSKKVCYDI